MGLFKSNNPFRHAGGQSTPPPSQQQGGGGGGGGGGGNNEAYAPPPGPPPSYTTTNPFITSSAEQKHPTQNDNDEFDYAPPPGPPPASSSTASHQRDDFAPPPGPPPPSHQQQQQHPWEAFVPDTSLFPPPPALFSGFDRSAASNATEDQAEAGEAWCRRYPLAPPTELSRRGEGEEGLWQFDFQRGGGSFGGSGVGFSRLIQPETNTFKGSLRPTPGDGGSGVWTLLTDRKAGDATVIGYPPVYLVQRDSPLLPSSYSKTIYYECRILSQNNKPGEIGLALGFTALPYPPFRMPGWHRGSLAVHADDGHRYVNDRWGGKEFTAPFAPGETVGLGMRFSCPSSSTKKGGAGGAGVGVGGGGGGGAGGAGQGQGQGAGGRIEVEVFFTRGGRVDGRWDLHEELDAAADLPVTGLEGYHDLAIAVGTFRNVAVEVVLDAARWMYRGVP